MIVSASRRTDIPAFYSEWIVERLKTGFALVRNPFNLRQVSKVILTPEAVDCFVFWTKDPKNMIDKLNHFVDYCYYFQFAITPYNRSVEPGLRDKREIIETFKKLSGKRYKIQRSKGLGENKPEMMWETTMCPASRRLVRVTPEDAAKTAEVFELLLGDNLQGRKDFIAERIPSWSDSNIRPLYVFSTNNLRTLLPATPGAEKTRILAAWRRVCKCPLGNNFGAGCRNGL